MSQPQRFVQRERRGRRSLVVAKTTAEETARTRLAEPLARAAKQAKDGTAIIAGKIHGTVKMFAAQRTNDRPVLADSCATAQ